MTDFSHILDWKLKVGSHQFPGRAGGTCINEAAVVAAGFPYQPIRQVEEMPDCFSRPICRLAMQLNDHASDAERQRLLAFVCRLACADTPDVELERARLIAAHGARSFDDGLALLARALEIGRQADPLGVEEARDRLDAVRPISLAAKVKRWLAPAA